MVLGSILTCQFKNCSIPKGTKDVFVEKMTVFVDVATVVIGIACVLKNMYMVLFLVLKLYYLIRKILLFKDIINTMVSCRNI